MQFLSLHVPVQGQLTLSDRFLLKILQVFTVHSLFLSFLTVFLLAGAEVKQLIKLRLQEHVLQPLHVALQACWLEVLHHPPH